MGARLLTVHYSIIYGKEYLEERYGDRYLDHFPNSTCMCYRSDDDEDDYYNQFLYCTDRDCNYCYETASSYSHVSMESLISHSADDDETSERDANFDDDSDEEDLCSISGQGDFYSPQSSYDLDDGEGDDLDSIDMQDPDDNWDDDLDLQDPDGFELENDSEEFEENILQPWEVVEKADFRVLENTQRSEYGHRLGHHTRRRKGTRKHQIYRSRRKKSHQTATDNFSIASFDIHEDLEDQIDSFEKSHDMQCFSTRSSQLKAKTTLLDFFPKLP